MSIRALDLTRRPDPAPAKAWLAGLSLPKLREEMEKLGVEPKKAKMRSKQLRRWLHHFGETDFMAMTDIAKDLRATLLDKCSLHRPEIAEHKVSVDGTQKWLTRFGPGIEAESVFIPAVAKSGALCVSSQVVCTLNCTFCYTGTQKLVRNLTAQEIVQQVLVARDGIGEWPSSIENRKLTNIVFMGMGEPLYNFDNVRDAMQIAMDGEGISLSRRRITLSTSGVVPQIAKTAEEIGCMLAVSFHATTDEVRNHLVPINRKWNIEALLDALRAYPKASNSERITFEYVMLKDVNDSDEDARRLVQLIKGIPAKINLIPFNEWPGSPHERSDWERIERFADIIYKAGYASPIRTPRGEDIMAACGQLKSATERERKPRREIEARAGM